MSKDKHRGVERRKFVLANLPKQQWGGRHFMRDFVPEPTLDKNKHFHRTIEVTKEIKQLEKRGKIKRTSVCAHSLFGRHIRRTVLEEKK